MDRIYLDHNATTPIREKVRHAVEPFIHQLFGNPSSRYLEGREVRVRVEEARDNTAAALDTTPETITFTSCATEGNNAVLRGYFMNYRDKNPHNHIIISAVEHPSVYKTALFLAKNGYEVSFVPVDRKGMLSLESVAAEIRPETGLISIMMANNEIGNIYPVKEIAALARQNNVLFHTDAVQAVGKIPVSIKEINPDFVTFSAHKFYGLKGVGGLYIRKGLKLWPYVTGGHQEKNKRAGTENVPGIISLGEAIKIAVKERLEDQERVGRLRDILEKRILEEIPFSYVNGDPDSRLYTTTNMGFKCIEGEAILLKLDYAGIAVSTGSACSSGSLEPSHVLLAMGIDEADAHSSIRFSLGIDNTEPEIHYTVDRLKEIVAQLRSYSPLWDDFLKKQ